MVGVGGSVQKRQSHLVAVVTMVEGRCCRRYGWWVWSVGGGCREVTVTFGGCCYHGGGQVSWEIWVARVGGSVEKRQSHLVAVVTMVEGRCRGG